MAAPIQKYEIPQLFYEGQVLTISLSDGTTHNLVCIEPCFMLPHRLPDYYLGSGCFVKKAMYPQTKPMIEVCMQGNPKPIWPTTLKWTHPDIQIEKDLPTQTFIAFCPHCKREWKVPMSTLEDMAGAVYLGGVLQVTDTIQQFVDGSGL